MPWIRITDFKSEVVGMLTGRKLLFGKLFTFDLQTFNSSVLKGTFEIQRKGCNLSFRLVVSLEQVNLCVIKETITLKNFTFRQVLRSMCRDVTVRCSRVKRQKNNVQNTEAT